MQSDSDTSEQTEYKRLIAIHAEKLKGSIKKVLKIENDMVRRLSLSEQALEKATISHGTNVVRYFVIFQVIGTRLPDMIISILIVLFLCSCLLDMILEMDMSTRHSK